MTQGLMIAAPASGSGKTTVMLGLARALCRSGQRVQCFKSGPDYIDPAFHRAATGRASFNLDSWAMGAGRIGELLAKGADADIALAEGSMGLHDGVAVPGALGTGASADVALLAGWPVVLVIDASGQAQTAGAVAMGMAAYRPGIRVAGVVLNKVASPRHEALLRAGMEPAGIAVFGALPRDAGIGLPERHLGLVQAGEHSELPRFLDRAANLITAHLDVAGMVAAAGSTPLRGEGEPITPPGQRIALAQDAAFTFTYPHLLDGWRAAGAEILPFSPLADQGPDSTADVCWLPGGYPELHAGRIAAAGGFAEALRRFAATRPVHGECGGYMVMGAGLEAADGSRHAMVGLLGLETSFAKRRMHLGYRRAVLGAGIPGHEAGAVLAGHEFHYASILHQPDAPLATVCDAAGASVAETGSRRGHATGTFFHLIEGAS
ncbi:cobyrinate a,c-diamide synthase [Falsirhodobacter xinxiangensis]|uniref:cobyrinate a,c-diamide synthase n=1 Tax=Falsirhodobacter xinxiangensis TaxID=2530049 RepID=UPI0010AA6CFE|nr:cobyrinate a,c-diamide synthase [Rhodobacter xinxiangensis]